MALVVPSVVNTGLGLSLRFVWDLIPKPGNGAHVQISEVPGFA